MKLLIFPEMTDHEHKNVLDLGMENYIFQEYFCLHNFCCLSLTFRNKYFHFNMTAVDVKMENTTA